MAKKARKTNGGDLAAVLRRLNPNVPAGLSEDVLPRIPRSSNALRQIRAHLSADPLAKLLLTGHIGVGKSTELIQLAHEFDGERRILWCSLARSLGVHNVNTFSLLVVLLHASIESCIREMGEMPPGLVEELVGHIRELLPKEKRPPAKSTPDALATTANPFFPANVSLQAILEGLYAPPTPSGRQLLDLYGEVLQRLALRSVTFEQAMALDPSPIAASCDVVLRVIADRVEKPVLLIIDDLDKVRDEVARDDIFLNRAMAWRRLPCGVVATLPLDTIFSKVGPELDQVWMEGPMVLDPLPVPEAEGGGPADEALQPYLHILRSIDAQNVISAIQCRKLANASSGLPRAFVSACATCVRYAMDSGKRHVRDYHIDLVLHDIADRWRGRLNDSDYRALVAVLDSGGSNVPGAIQMLRDGILVRDGSAPPEGQFRLANWAAPLVEAYRRRVHRGQSTLF